ncbi:MAG: hypothetical protein ABH869_05560 [Candidatus Omnitrophota bacterium]
MDEVLGREIEIEKEFIKKTLKLLNKAMARKRKTEIELTAIGAFLHDIYNGMENIIKRTLKAKGIRIKDTGSFHKDLLDRAVEEKIVSQTLSERLDEYRGFRHFFVHGYGLNLRKDELISLAKGILTIWKDFEKEARNYLSN